MFSSTHILSLCLKVYVRTSVYPFLNIYWLVRTTVQTTIICTFLKISARTTKKKQFFFKTELTNLVTQSTYLQDSTRAGCCRLPYWASSSSSTGSSPWTRMSLLKRSAARLPRSKISWIKNSGIDTQRTLVFSYSAILPGPAYSVLLRVNGVQILYISV